MFGNQIPWKSVTHDRPRAISNRRWAVSLLSAFLLLIGLPAQADQLGISTDFAIRYEDNIGLAADSADKFDAVTYQFGVGMDWMFVETPTVDSGLSFGLYHDEVSDLGDLSHYGVEAGVHYRGQSSADLTAFWWKLAGDIRTLKYRDSDIRDGYIYELGATIGKRLNQRFGLNGGYRYERRISTEDDPKGQMMTWNPDKVFDLQKDVLFLQAELSLGAVTTMTGTVSYKDGTEATTGRFGMLGPMIDWAWDRAFGPGYQVWKIDAEQYIFDLDLTHSFTEKFSIDATFSYVDATGDAGPWGEQDYKNWIVSMGIAYRF